MDRTERFYKIERMLRTNRVVRKREFLTTLSVSEATFKRDLEYLRERLHAPIPYDREQRGYRLGIAEPGSPPYELPGLWFNAAELHALLTFYHLLDTLQPGLLGPHIEPLRHRIATLLEKTDHSFEEIARRVRILSQAARHTEPRHFQLIAHALLARHRLHMRYHGRGRDTVTERTVSPQRLVHYRDNWYLDAWDHGKRALRTFSLDRISAPAPIGQAAREISDQRLDHHFASSYGIFAGQPKHKAVLRFTPERARWVAEERWHPAQKGRLEGGYYILEVPYSDDRELIMDILKFGPDVEVLGPDSLRARVRDCLRAALARYPSTP